MVSLPGKLINRPHPGKFDRGEPTFFQQNLDIPVDRCNPQSFYLRLSRMQHLGRRQRAIGPFESFADRGALSSVSLASFGGLHSLMISRYQ